MDLEKKVISFLQLTRNFNFSTLSDPETGIGAKPAQVQPPPADESAHIWGTNGKDVGFPKKLYF